VSFAGTSLPPTPPPALPAANGPEPSAPSFVELWLAMPIGALRTALERAFPRDLRPSARVDTARADPLDTEIEAAGPGHSGEAEREWQGRPVRWRGRLRREPFEVRLHADSLTVLSTIGWSVEVLERGLESARCGSANAPLGGSLGAASLLGWSDDWSLETRSHALPTRLAKSCRLDPPGLDFTHRVNDRLQQALVDRLPARVDSVVRVVTNQSANVRAALQLLARPVMIGDSTAWLQWNVRTARVDPPRGRGDSILTHVTFEASPSIEPRPGSIATPPLPAPLVRLSGSGIRVSFDCWVQFADIAGDLASLPAGRTDRGAGAVRVTGARVTGGGNRVAIALDLDGPVTGTAWLAGTLSVATPHFVLGCEDLEWSVESRRALQAAAGPARWPGLRLSLAELRDALRRRMQRPLEDCVAAWEKGIQAALQPSDELPTLQGGIFQREVAEVFCTDHAIGVRVLATGRAQLFTDFGRAPRSH
jgi:hypothetical protein